MRVEVKVIPNAKKIKVEKFDGRFKVHLTAQPQSGKANKELIEVLAEHFKVKKNNVKIIKREKSREKVVEIL